MATSAVAPRGSTLMELVAWIGLALGLVCFTSSALAGPPTHQYAAALPSPQEITAYTTAICGAVLTVVNTLFIIWHKLQKPPKRPRKPAPKRKAKPDGEAPQSGPTPAPAVT